MKQSMCRFDFRITPVSRLDSHFATPELTKNKYIYRINRQPTGGCEWRTTWSRNRFAGRLKSMTVQPPIWKLAAADSFWSRAPVSIDRLWTPIGARRLFFYRWTKINLQWLRDVDVAIKDRPRSRKFAIVGLKPSVAHFSFSLTFARMWERCLFLS